LVKKRTYIMETIVVSAIIMYFTFYIKVNKEVFFNLNIHPFVILMGINAWLYGSQRAFVSATIVSLFFYGAYLSLGKDPLLYFKNFSYFKFVLFFYGVAISIGTLKDRKVKKLKELDHTIATHSKEYYSLFKRHQELIYKYKRSKDEIICSEESIFAVYDIYKELHNCSKEESLRKIPKILDKLIGAEEVSIYQYNDDFFTRIIKVGERENFPRTFKLNEIEKVKKVVEKRGLGKKRNFDEDLPVMYYPIYKYNEIKYLIAIDKLNFEKYTLYVERNFIMICDWIQMVVDSNE